MSYFAIITFDCLLCFVLLSVPPLTIVPVQNQLNDIYAGTVIQLNCMILLSELINTPSINVNSNWLRNGNSINVVDNRILNNETMFGLLNYSANLFFLPISTTDNGNYQCNIVVSGDEYVTPSSMNSSDIELIVEGKTSFDATKNNYSGTFE